MKPLSYCSTIVQTLKVNEPEGSHRKNGEKRGKDWGTTKKKQGNLKELYLWFVNEKRDSIMIILHRH